jgi:hypothetical protein
MFFFAVLNPPYTPPKPRKKNNNTHTHRSIVSKIKDRSLKLSPHLNSPLHSHLPTRLLLETDSCWFGGGALRAGSRGAAGWRSCLGTQVPCSRSEALLLNLQLGSNEAPDPNDCVCFLIWFRHGVRWEGGGGRKMPKTTRIIHKKIKYPSVSVSKFISTCAPFFIFMVTVTKPDSILPTRQPSLIVDWCTRWDNQWHTAPYLWKGVCGN